MPTPINPSQFPEYIYGVHDLGGQVPMLNARRLGWIVDSVDLRAQAGTDYTRLASAGLGVIVRLNNGFDTAGTIPPSDQYDAFAAQCAAYVSNSPGARIWIIGNEMNSSAERPLLLDGSREVITPELYALCFLKCRDAIKNLPGHADDWVISGAIAPYNADTGDWVRYLVDLLVLLDTEVDGIALHCYTHDFSATQITSDVVLDPPYDHHHSDFRAYRDFLNAIPARFRSLPVFITETSPFEGWENSNVGWIQAAYTEIAEWNANLTHQAIQALVLFRWQAASDYPEWNLQDKLALQDDFAAALNEGYRARWTPPEPLIVAPPPAPMIESPKIETPVGVPAPKQYAAQFLAHDTPVALVVGQIVTANVRVKNTGAAMWKSSGANSIHLGYRWFDANGAPHLDVEDRRTALPAAVAANDETMLGAWLIAPKTPGKYQLHWNLNFAGSDWFADALVLPVVVTSGPQAITGWRVEASENPSLVARALDGDPLSFWESGAPQKPGQWFRLNLGAPRLVDGIQFLSPGKNFPAGYLLRVSADGRTWIEIARVRSGNPFDVMPIFAPIQIQYAQIDLLAASPTPWMISEILAHPATAWTATTNHNPRAAGRALDNRAETAWASGAAQTPGMWFQIDLGRVETVSGLTLIAPANEHPVGFRITTWNASANHWQVVCERRNNRAPVDVSFAAGQTQFINIQLTQASKLPWAIQHVRVAREMENWLGPGD
ncbi:MAG: discoidin domain-containing protein [Anaerolineales bacterium]|nr:discoidin domain-containing protein [Anaerolineales bacterium]